MTSISAEEFEKRLVDLCVRSGSVGLPRSVRDRHILLKSVVTRLDASTEYTEREINGELQSWLTDIGPAMDLDHAALRRYLVDEGYLERDPQGTRYRVSSIGSRTCLFDPAVNQVDVLGIVRDSRERIERRKREYVRPQEVHS